MSTRCNIHFNYGDEIVANIYRNSDGYPEGVVPDLREFFEEVKRQTKDTRFSDPSYLAAKFVVWQADQFARSYDFKNDKWVKDEPLNFISLGIDVRDAGDGEYVYDIDCNSTDEHGFPKVHARRANGTKIDEDVVAKLFNGEKAEA